VNLRSAAVTVVGMLLAAAAVLWLFERQISGPWFRLAVHPEITAALEAAMEDEKRLAHFEPQSQDKYRARFENTRVLLNHLDILDYNRERITRRWELIVLAAVGGVLALAGGAHLLRQGRQDARLERLRRGLVALSAGEEDLRIDDRDRGRDTLGRIAGMIEETSRVMARDRKRLAYLKNLSVWQETARRHAHEMRTPLTAARLELSRLQQLLAAEPAGPADNQEETRLAALSVGEELERLGKFTQQFTSFARLSLPRPAVHDLGPVVAEFVATFAAAWPNLILRYEAPGKPLPAALDRDMVRQVLVNLCDNSALAIRTAEGTSERSGTVTLRPGEAEAGIVLDVTDDGPGIPPDIRSRVFDPYVTTRRVGEGMGLGLAISKKILLDHGGDLEVLASSGEGTTFRLTFPRQARPEPGQRQGEDVTA
jgi:two-component system nitrogen regulation sensor histidine kinase NtrY